MAAHLPHPLTIDSLYDDVLVPLLGLLPLHHQLTTYPLTSPRWSALLPQLTRKRTTFIIWNTQSEVSPPLAINSLPLFDIPIPADTLPYTDYQTCLFTYTDNKTMGSLNTDYYLNLDFYLRSSTLNDRLYRQLTDIFPHLTSLAIVKTPIDSKVLLYLLSHYRHQLECLYLELACPVPFSFSQPKEMVLFLSLLNSMATLRQLTLANFPNVGHFNRPAYTGELLADTISGLLSQLEVLQLQIDHLDVYPVLLCLNETKIRRLGLVSCEWKDDEMFTYLVSEKPDLGNLSHLTVGQLGLLGEANPCFKSLKLVHVQVIASAFPQLIYLDIVTEIPLLDLLPNLCTLKQLETFKLNSAKYKWQSRSPWTVKKSAQPTTNYTLESLSTLTLTHVRLNIEVLTHLGPAFPKVTRLYLESCQFYCPKTEGYFSLPSDRPSKCTCKDRLAEALATFVSLPKVPKVPPKESYWARQSILRSLRNIYNVTVGAVVRKLRCNL